MDDAELLVYEDSLRLLTDHDHGWMRGRDWIIIESNNVSFDDYMCSEKLYALLDVNPPYWSSILCSHVFCGGVNHSSASCFIAISHALVSQALQRSNQQEPPLVSSDFAVK